MLRTFRTKILIGYGVALGLIVLVFAGAVASIQQLGRASNSILHENYQSILAAENMIDAIERQDSALLAQLLRPDSAEFQAFRENENLFLQWLGRSKDNITILGEKEIIDSIEKNYTAFLSHVSNLLVTLETDRGEAEAVYRQAVQPLFLKIRDTCIHLRDINQETMFWASRRAQLLASRSTWFMAAIGLAAVVLGLLFSLILSHRLSRPVRDLQAAALRIAEGDYEINVQAGKRDELGTLAEHFNVMANRLKAFQELNIGRILAEKRKSEAIIHSVDDGIVVADAELRITNINPMAAGIFNVDPDEAVDRHFLEIVKHEQLFTLVKRTFEMGQPISGDDERNMVSFEVNGTSEHYQYSIVPVRAKTGGLLGVVLLLRNITRLRELDRLKSEFIMTASHELRTPLTSIGMSVGILMESVASRLTDRERQLLTAAHEDVQRLKSLVNELLDLSKIEAGQLTLENERVSVQLLAEKALSVVQAQAEEKGASICAEVPEGLPEVQVDPNKVVWVLVNLFVNAIRYTERGGHIRLGAEAIGPHVHISVRDDGVGIPYEYQAKIFDKFVQVRSDRHTGGSGLGLAISKEIVRAHGGTIWLDSIPGQGATFTFTIPVA